MEDGLPPGPSKHPLAVLAGEHGALGEVGEGGLGQGGHRDTEQEEDSVEHVIVIPHLSPALLTADCATTIVSSAQLPARLGSPCRQEN